MMSNILGPGARDRAGSWVFGFGFLVQEKHGTLYETLSAPGNGSSSNSVLEAAFQSQAQLSSSIFSASTEASVSVKWYLG
jgi:hypothetical protein